MGKRLPLSIESSATGLSLPRRLQSQHKDRWTVLLDALFSAEAPQRLALSNSFLQFKGNGNKLLSCASVNLSGPALAPTAASSQRVNGLLTEYWSFPASILPALVCNPTAGSSLLILGQPPAGRLLTLAQLLLASPPAAASKQEKDGLTKTSTASQANSAARISAEASPSPVPGSAAIAPQQLTPPSATRSQTELDAGSPGWQAGLPWHIYGEGLEPQAWSHQSPDVASIRRESTSAQPLKTQDSEVEGWQQQYWSSLGGLVKSVLHRSVRAGCCTVKTSSGDWAVIAEEAMQAEATAQQGKALSAAADLSHPSLEAEHEANAGHMQSTADVSCSDGDILMTCIQPSAEAQSQFQELLQHHLPPNLRRCIRLEAPRTGKKHWWRPGRSGRYNAVVVEAPCTASASAVVAACQSATPAPWLQKADEELIDAQADMLWAGFDALEVGGCLLFCSSSLAYEETEGVVQRCLSALDRSAKVLRHPRIASHEASEALGISLKRFGAEQTELGWRMLPDLCFQGPQYFSLLQKVVDA